jgi:TPR repeat protein
MWKRGCDGGNGYSCAMVGEAHEIGKDAGKDPIRAQMLYIRGCNAGNMSACGHLGRVLYDKNKDNAKIAFNQACSNAFQHGLDKSVACASLKVLYGDNRPAPIAPPSETSEARAACDGGNAYACTDLGLVEAATNMGPMAKQHFQRACMTGYAFACALKDRVK